MAPLIWSVVRLGGHIENGSRVGSLSWITNQLISFSNANSGTSISSVVVLGGHAWYSLEDGLFAWGSHAPLSISAVYFGADIGQWSYLVATGVASGMGRLHGIRAARCLFQVSTVAPHITVSGTAWWSHME